VADLWRMAHHLVDVAAALGLLVRRSRGATGKDISVKPVHTVVFAKAPLPGYAKTRLIPALGAEGAAQLAKEMLRHTVTQVLAADTGTVELCVTPGPQAPAWGQLKLPQTIQWTDQGDGDLGQRLARASQRVTQAGAAVLLVGTDCPELTAARLTEASSALLQHDACLIPVTDGGYALLGLQRHLPTLFENIPWSTATVACLTRQRLADAGWRVAQLETLHDIDTPPDLQWLDAGLGKNPTG